MLKLEVIGNLGSDARLESSNGGEFVCFNVAHTERVSKSDGQVTEKTVWVSCTLNGRNEKLMPYLKKGQKVWVNGDPTFRTFHSEKQRQLVVGVNLFVRTLELVGAQPEAVPRVLFSTDGVQVDVSKYYWSKNDDNKPRALFSQGGAEFVQDNNGFIYPTGRETVQQEEQQNVQTTSDNNAGEYFGEPNDNNPLNVGNKTVDTQNANDQPSKTEEKKQTKSNKK